METQRHTRLKVLSAAMLRALGCSAAAFEVRCPSSRYRADVAGFADPLPKAALPRFSDESETRFSLRVHGRPTTVIIECKQSRADFLRDNRALDRLIERRRRLDTQRRDMEASLLPVCEPHLRASGAMLFPEMEQWDYSASRSPAYRRLARELRSLDEQIHGQTKFWLMARYAVADVLLIAAPRGLLRPAETPPGWGLLELPPMWLHPPGDDGTYADPLRAVLRPAVASPLSDERRRVRLLRNIAVAGCQRLHTRLGTRPEIEIAG